MQVLVSYLGGKMIEDVKGDGGERVTGSDNAQRKNEASFCNTRRRRGRIKRSAGCLPFLSPLDLRVLGVLSAFHPKENSHDAEVCRKQHSTREICPNADETVPLHEEIEEKALVKML